MSPSLKLNLIESNDFSSFLHCWIQDYEKSNGRGAQALICRRAGFSSRSYLSEILSGKKGLSRDSLSRLKSAMKLSSDFAKLFDLLAHRSFPKLSSAGRNPAELEFQIEKIRSQLRTEKIVQKSVVPIIQSPECFQVYASLGTLEKGASLKEVEARTKLPIRQIKMILKVLMEKEIVHEIDERFYANASKLDHLNAIDSKAVARMIQKVCANIHKKAFDLTAEEKNLNVYSAFSVRREKLNEFKVSLEKALFQVLDEYQDDSGDCVQQVFLSSYQSPMEVER